MPNIEQIVYQSEHNVQWLGIVNVLILKILSNNKYLEEGLGQLCEFSKTYVPT